MVHTKGIAATVEKYKSAIPRVGAEYKKGVDSNTDWQANAIAAEPLYAEKIQAAIAAGSRAKGLQATSQGEWKNAASVKGSARIGQGMTEAVPKFQSGMSEVINTIEGVTLPARTSSGVQNVQNRVIPIVQALEELKKRRG